MAPLTRISPEKVPELRSGDRLSREEFERRYHAMPEVNRAELIEGVVSMPSPVNFVHHGQPHAHLIWFLTHYVLYTPGVRVGDNTTVRLDASNEPQPDAVLLITPECGGQARIVDGFIEGSPELVAEVAASSVSIDRNAKFRAYQRNGIREYLLWRVEDQALDWFVLREQGYVLLAPGEDGILRSEVFAGLWLDAAALLRGDLARVLAVLQQGLASEGHATFVAGLGSCA